MQSERFHGLMFDTGRFDTGNKIDWLRATLELGVRDPVLGPELQRVIDRLASNR